MGKNAAVDLMKAAWTLIYFLKVIFEEQTPKNDSNNDELDFLFIFLPQRRNYKQSKIVLSHANIYYDKTSN